jgi:hypothetical protein
MKSPLAYLIIYLLAQTILVHDAKRNYRRATSRIRLASRQWHRGEELSMGFSRHAMKTYPTTARFATIPKHWRKAP